MSYIELKDVVKSYSNGNVIAANRSFFYRRKRRNYSCCRTKSEHGKTTVLNLIGGMDNVSNRKDNCGQKRY